MVALPRGVVTLAKLTVPAGVPEPETTVAVSVTFDPAYGNPARGASVVVVAMFVTVTETVLLVDAA